MQTSAKTKAKHFCKLQELPDHVQDALVILLKEHERDTRYTAIDILNSMDRYQMEASGSTLEERMQYEEGIGLDEAVSRVFNLGVGHAG